MSESSEEILKRMDEPYNSVGRWAIQCALDCRNAEREVERLRAIIDRCGICRDLLDGKRTVVQKQWDDVQKELEQWKLLAACQAFAVSAVARDRHYKCQCGHPPYTDGDICPKCFSICEEENLARLRKKMGLKLPLTKKRKGPKK